MLAFGERGYGDGSNPYTWLSSIALPQWLPGFLPQAFPTTVSSHTSPSIRLSAVNSSPRPGIAPQSLNSSSQPLSLLGDLHSCPGYGVARTVWISFPLVCCRSAVSLSALNVYPLTQTIALMWGSDTCFSSPTHWGPMNAPFFPPLVPSSYWVLHGSIYSFPLVGYSCLLSAGVLRALLCLKLYCWCICGERCTPRSPTPMASCSHSCFFFWELNQNHNKLIQVI